MAALALLGRVPAKAWLILGVVCALAGTHLLYGHYRYKAGYATMAAKHNADMARITAKAAEKQAEARVIERKMADKVGDANVAHAKDVRIAGDLAGAYRRGLRDAAASAGRGGVPADPRATDGCPVCPRCATRAELLGIGEALIGVAENADREHAAALACAMAWPRE